MIGKEWNLWLNLLEGICLRLSLDELIKSVISKNTLSCPVDQNVPELKGVVSNGPRNIWIKIAKRPSRGCIHKTALSSSIWLSSHGKREKCLQLKWNYSFRYLSYFKGHQKSSTFHQARVWGQRNKIESPKVKNKTSDNFELRSVNGTIFNCEWLPLGRQINRQVQFAACWVLNPNSNLSIKGKKINKNFITSWLH